MKILSFLFTVLFGYIIGSVNLSILVTKYIGKFDIHTRGSGNAGGTNVARTMGAKYGIPVIVLEIAKCFAVGLFCRFVFPCDPFSIGVMGEMISGYAAVFGCLIGNIFPLFHGFSGGGKGVTVAAGAICIADWRIFLFVLAIFLVVFLTTRMVSAGSLTAAIAIPISVAVVYHTYDYWYILFSMTLAVSLIVIFRHRKNIVRIFKGEENKFSFSKKKQ